MRVASEFIFKIDGCPWAPATAGCPNSITYVDSDDGGDTPDTATILRGWLVHPLGPDESYEHTAELSVPEGDLTQGGQTFKIHDLPIPSGAGAGKGFATWTSTRPASSLSSTTTPTVITGATGTLLVDDPSIFDSGGGVLWIDQEAIHYSGVSGGTVTIDARGYYGSLEVDHDTGVTVFAEYPGHDRRRVVLYGVDASGNATSLWRGYLEESLSPADSDEGHYVAACRGSWDREREAALGSVSASCAISGYDLAAVRLACWGERVTYTDTYFTGPRRLSTDVVVSPSELASNLLDEIRRQLQAAVLWSNSAGLTVDVTTSGSTLRVVFRVYGAAAQDRFASTVIIAGVRSVATSNTTAADGAQVYSHEVDLPPVCRTIWIGTAPSADAGTVQVDTVYGLPTSWSEVSVTQDSITTSTRPILRAPWGDDAWLVIEPTGTTDDPPALTGCRVSLAPKRPGPITAAALGAVTINAPRGAGGGTYQAVFITESAALTSLTRVKSGHWLYALRYAVCRDGSAALAADYVGAQVDRRNWDFSACAEVAAITRTAGAGVLWHLDGSTTLNGLLSDYDPFAGCATMIRKGGRIAIRAFQPPIPTTDLALEVDQNAGDGTEGHVMVQVTSRRALLNGVQLTTLNGTLRVIDSVSRRRYGQTAELEVRLDSDDTSILLTGSTSTLAAFTLSRTIGGWSEPAHSMLITVPSVPGNEHLVANASEVYQGDYIRVNASYSLPDGQGNRGYTLTTTQKVTTTRGMGQVIAARQRGADVELEVVVWSLSGFAGFSPCARVESITGHQALVLSKSYLSAATSTKNYDGSDPTTGDGGASHFQPSMKIALYLRNSTTVVREAGLEVDHITGNTIYLVDPLSGTPDWDTLIAGGAIVDVLFDTYDTSGLTDRQKAYAWIGNDSNGKIGASSDLAPRWAP